MQNQRPLTQVIISIVIFTILLLSAPADAQFSPDIYSATRPLSGDQLNKVTEFITKQVEMMKSVNTKSVRSANKALAEPIMNPKASRTFRLAYSDALTPLLTAILDSEESPIHSKISALHMLGSVATDDSINALEKYVSSDVEAIRYAAASGYQRAFEAYQSARATYDASRRLVDIIRLLRNAMEVESQPVVLYAYANACASAPGNDGAALAIESIGKGLEAQFKDMYTNGPDNRLKRYSSCINLILRRYVALIGTGNRDMKVEKSIMAEVSVTGIMLALDQIGNEDLPSELAAHYTDLVQVCENVLNIIYHETDDDDTIVSETFDKNMYDVAQRLFETQWLAENGPIFNRSIYGFKPGHFKRILGI